MSKTIFQPNRAAAGELYEDYLDVIAATANAHARKRGTPSPDDVEELTSKGSVIFMEAYNGYKPELGTFEGRLLSLLHRRLLDDARRYAKKTQRLRRDETADPDAEPAPETGGWDRDALESRVGDDGAEILRLLFDGDPVLDSAVRNAGRPGPAQVRSAIRSILTARGWPANRIVRAFQTIRSML